MERTNLWSLHECRSFLAIWAFSYLPRCLSLAINLVTPRNPRAPRPSRSERAPPNATAANRNVRFGMPAVAFADLAHPENYLIERPQYVLSYNNRTKTPNWVCWNLTKADIGNTESRRIRAR